jgi:SAM-dependent methyltransferase
MAVDEEKARALWDESADAWDEFIEAGHDYYRLLFHGPALLDACGDVRGRDVLDLGCGQGWFSRQLARAGARVIGIDWSTALIAHACRHERTTPLGIRYEVHDAMRLDGVLAPRTFDLVTGCMSLMDMPRPGDALRAVRPLVRDGGRIVASVSSPFSDTPYREWERDANGHKIALKVDRYFEATPSVLEWNLKRYPRRFRTVAYRYTLEQWSRMIEEAGLLIMRLREPRPTAEALAQQPALEDATRLPYVLVFELQAPSGSSA